MSETLALLLAEARRDAKQIAGLPAALVPADAAAAYAVQDRVTALLGWEPLGWKVAATSDAMRERLRMPEPIFGRSFLQAATHGDSVRYRHAELLDPIIEPEFLFLLARDLPPREAPWTEAEVAEAVAAVHAGVELAECRFPYRALPPFTAILADGSGNGRYLIGPEIAGWRDADLAAMPVALWVNGALRRQGTGFEVMGHPLRSLVWLANRLPAAGAQLRAGEWVSTGTLTGTTLARAGDAARVVFGDGIELLLEFA